MKFIVLLGGALGFLTAVLTDLLGDCQPQRLLLDGAVGCLVGAYLFRWFWNVLLNGFRETYLARQRAAATPPPAPRPTPAPAAAKPRL